MKIYQVMHMYDEDGGFGDSVTQMDVVETFSKKEDADKFVEIFSNPHVYSVPYDELCCGNLYVKEIEILSSFDEVDMDKSHYWWLRENEDDDDDEDDDKDAEDDEEEMNRWFGRSK